ncbi:UNVERIFIED_CONTAM: hypothetical protein FKN15_066474 [Acipenser sinensis]
MPSNTTVHKLGEKQVGCTDVICCIFFMVFIGGYLVVGVLAWLYGDPRQVIYPRNSTGVFCGIGPNEGKPYVFYFDILKCATGTNIMAAALNGLQCPTTQVCVNTCPNSYWIVPLSGYFPNANPRDVFSDKYCSPAIDLKTTKLTVDQILSKELCARFYIPSTPVFNRCIPKIADLPDIPSNFTLPGTATANETASSIISATGDLFMGFNAKALGVKIFEDFAKSWYWIVIGLLIAMLASLLFLLLLRFVAGVMVWVLIVGVIGVIGYGIWHCYWEYSNYKANNASISAIGFTSDVSVLLRVQETWLAFLIILAVLEVVLLLSLIFLRKRILIAIALIKEASKVVVLDKVTDLLLLFGKLMVVGGVGVLAFFFFSGRIEMPGETFSASSLNYYWVPIITVVVGSYMIAKGFFSVYSMCVDTLFLCFLWSSSVLCGGRTVWSSSVLCGGGTVWSSSVLCDGGQCGAPQCCVVVGQCGAPQCCVVVGQCGAPQCCVVVGQCGAPQCCVVGGQCGAPQCCVVGGQCGAPQCCVVGGQCGAPQCCVVGGQCGAPQCCVVGGQCGAPQCCVVVGQCGAPQCCVVG